MAGAATPQTDKKQPGPAGRAEQGDRTLTRRERLRAEMTADIKTVALRLLAEGGPDAISLRAIAREIGVTPGALYGYYATRDDLVTTLIADIYGHVADLQEAARDALPAADAAGRVLAVGTAFREWAIAHPPEFRLLYGDPVPGYQGPEGDATVDAQARSCAVLAGLVADAWDSAAPVQPAVEYEWSDFGDAFAEGIRAKFPELPPEAVALSMRVWGRMHGLVSLEIYGHLSPQIVDPAKLYRLELLDLVRSLGLPPVK